MDLSFLGLRCWLLENRDHAVVINPQFRTRYGWSDQGWGDITPHRTINPNRLCPIQAVVLTGETSEHLDLHSINVLDRGTLIAVPAQFPRVLAEVVETLGFVVRTIPCTGWLDFESIRVQQDEAGRTVVAASTGHVIFSDDNKATTATAAGTRLPARLGARHHIDSTTTKPLSAAESLALAPLHASTVVEVGDRRAWSDRELRDAWHQITEHLPVLARELIVSRQLPADFKSRGLQPDWGPAPLYLQLDGGPARYSYGWVLDLNNVAFMPVQACTDAARVTPSGLRLSLPDMAELVGGNLPAEELLVSQRICAWHSRMESEAMARIFLDLYGPRVRPALTWRYLNNLALRMLAIRAAASADIAEESK